MSDKHKRIQGGNGDFKIAQTCFVLLLRQKNINFTSETAYKDIISISECVITRSLTFQRRGFS